LTLLLLKTMFNITASMIVCVCKAVSDRDIAKAVCAGAKCLDDVTRCTGAGTGCGTCHQAIQQAIDAGPRRPEGAIALPMLAAVVVP
jgi:bacterioferritin-associated ferredoxin